MQNFCFCQLSMQILWRRRCSRVVDLKLPNMKISRRHLADYVKNCIKKRAARAARWFSLIQPIKSLICGVVVVVPIVVFLTPNSVVFRTRTAKECKTHVRSVLTVKNVRANHEKRARSANCENVPGLQSFFRVFNLLVKTKSTVSVVSTNMHKLFQEYAYTLLIHKLYPFVPVAFSSLHHARGPTVLTNRSLHFCPV